jgi:hypothetical protein
MKFKLLLAFSFWMLVMAVSCNKDDISFDAPSQELSFSKDTVFCDTVYHQVRSETYAVKVYNNEDKDILIPDSSAKRATSLIRSMWTENRDMILRCPLRKKQSVYFR